LRFGQIHFAFSVRRAQLEGAVAKVQSAGIAVYGPVRFEWMDAASYYFYDRDANLLEWWSPDINAGLHQPVG
jgi:hypothetical protein